jgi:EmrB/QacA subfamily drug resistance transporter
MRNDDQGGVTAGELPAPRAAGAGTTPGGDPHKWLILSAVGLGLFMALLDATIVNIAVPAIIQDLHTSIAQVSWVLNAYNLTLAALFLSVGRLADRFGQKLIFVIGLVIFTTFSLACGLAPNIQWLIGFRVLQAVGAAGMVPVSLAIVLGAFPLQQQGIATGLWGAVGAVAAALGPVLGGVLVTYGSWHWIFFVNVPVGIFALVAAVLVVPERKRLAGSPPVDYLGTVLSASGFFCLTLALIQGNSWGWGSARTVGLFIGAAALLGLFVFWETRSSAPMLDLRLFRIRAFSAANAGMLLVGTAFGGSIFLLVIFMVTVMGYSELRAAVSITPMPVTALILAPFVGRLNDRIGPRILALLGAGFFTVALYALSMLSGTASIGDVIWRTVLLGLGIAFTIPTMTAAGMASLPHESGGVGAGAINTSRQFGFVLGVAVLVAIFSHTVQTEVRIGVSQATGYVQSVAQLPPPARAAIIAGVHENAARAASRGSGSAANLTAPPADLPQAPPGSALATTLASLRARLVLIFRTALGNAFQWPYLVASVVALLSAVPALFLGRRLGSDLGRERRVIS